MLIRSLKCLLCLLLLCVCVCVSSSDKEESSSEDPPSHLLRNIIRCLRREYTLKAIRSDDNGRTCWDFIRSTSCWGRCDSFEIPDWKFPYKISYHPVCVHDKKVLRRVLLRHCDPGVDPDLRIYEYYDAETCSCKMCNSSDTFCDWRSHQLPSVQHTHISRSHNHSD